jgi:hypothetical protein
VRHVVLPSSCTNTNFFVVFLAEHGTASIPSALGIACQHAMPYLYTRTQSSDTISCVRISQAFMPDCRWTTKSGCQHGPFRKRTLTMIYICLSLAALGLVSLAGCEVQEGSHFNTAAETIQVPCLAELFFRPRVAVRRLPCDTRTMAYA